MATVSVSWAAEPYKIGAVITITGSGAFVGEPERNTIVMLAEKYNRQGGINGHPIELVVYDDASDTSKTVTALKKLMEVDKVPVVIGPAYSAGAMAAIPFAERRQIPLLPIAVHKEISDPLKKWVFQVANTIDQESRKILEEVKRRKAQNIGIIHVSDQRGMTARDSLLRLAPEYGIKAVRIESFTNDDTDMTPQLTRIKAANAQVLVSALASQTFAILAKNYTQLGMKIPHLSGTGIGNVKFARLAGEAANGVVFPGYKIDILNEIPKSDPQFEVMAGYRRDFEGRFKDPANIFGALAHDGFAMTLMAMKKAGSDPAKIRDELERLGTYTGAAGVWRWTPTDHCGFATESFSMIEIWNGKFRLAK